MAQVTFTWNPNEILRVFTKGSEKEGFRLPLPRGLMPCTGSPRNRPGQSAMNVQRECADSRNGVRAASDTRGPFP